MSDHDQTTVPLLERMARLICRTHERLERGKDSDDAWMTWMGTARHILEDMREPTISMVGAAIRNNHPRDIDTWQTMIDAALDEV